jgi:GntR family transcriptional regulator, N-acetylglucosamine utilization regulator
VELKSKHLSVSDLSIKPTDPDSPIPLYHQIEVDLRRLVDDNELSPGSIIPPELELSRAYGVGRHTMRTALSRLAADDLIARYSGRGTFVKSQSERKRFSLDRSFTQQMADMGYVATSKTLEVSSAKIDISSPEVLQPRLGEDCLNLVRLRFGDHVPIGIQSSTVLTAKCQGIETFDFNKKSLYEVLSKEFGLIVAEISHTISAIISDRHQAGLLEISELSPLLMINTTARLGNGEIIEYTTSYYRGDMYEYSTTYTY